MITNKKSKSYFVGLLAAGFFMLAGYDSASAADEPQISSAPDRGNISSLTNHYTAQASFYDFSQLPIKQITPTIGLRFIMSSQMILLEWHLKKANTLLPLHNHVNEQINLVESGKLAVYSQGKKYVLNKGQSIVFPPFVPHEFEALENNTVFLDIQTPARQDFINGDFDKRAKTTFK